MGLTFCLVVATVAVLCGCGGSAIQVGTHKYPPVNPASVEILYQEPAKPYEVVALVDQQGSGFDFSADSTIPGQKTGGESRSRCCHNLRRRDR
jgi:hypothetical protein